METEEKKKDGLLEQYHKAEADEMAGKPWYIRHKSSLLILGLTLLGWIFCAVWSYYFPYGIW